MKKTYRAIAAMMLGLSLAAGMLSGCVSKPSTSQASSEAGSERETGNTADKNNAVSTAQADAAVEKPEDKAEEKEECVQPVSVFIEQHTVSASNQEAYSQIAEHSYNYITLSEEDAKKYPELAKTFTEENKQKDEDKRETLSQLIGMYDQMYEDYDGDNEGFPYTMTDNSKISVLRADSNVVSLFGEYSGYYGGVHGYYSYFGCNYDTKTGKKLVITDVITDMDKMFELIDAQLQERYPEQYEYFVKMDDYKQNGNYDVMAFSLGNECVRVYFNPYEIGSYADGVQVVDIYFDEHPELIQDKYMKTLDSYIMPFTENLPFYLNVRGDGREKISLTSDMPDDHYYEWQITAGRRSVKINDGCYSENSYIVCRDGKYYLYLFETSDNDYVMMRLIDLEKMDYDPDYMPGYQLADQDHTYDDSRDAEGIYEYSNKKAGFSDPDDFVFTERIFLMGTLSGERHFHIGAAGIPETEDEFYTIRQTGVIKANMPIKCDVVDHKNGTSTDGVIPEGTFLIYAATDGESWVELQEVDASLVESNEDPEYQYFRLKENMNADMDKPVYHVRLEKKDWYYAVDGVEDQDAFTGVVYAG